MSGLPLFKAALFSLILAAIKIIVFFYSGSLIVLASFFDSVMDSLLSFANFTIFRIAHTKADKNHPFGHGGFEVLSGLIQGTVFIGFGMSVVWQAVNRLFVDDSSQLIAENLLGAIGLMLFAAVSGYLLSRMLHKEQKKMQLAGSRSQSVDADQAHYLTDFYINLLGAISLGLVFVSGLEELDAILSTVGAFLLGKTGLNILNTSIDAILHKEVDQEEKTKIRNMVLEVDARIQGVHRLRMRVSGPNTFADFHLTLDAMMTLQEAHDIGEKVSRHLKRNIPHIEVLIHLDPDTEPEDELW